MPADRRKRVRWPQSKVLQFSLGLDTTNPFGSVAPTALIELQNAEGTRTGAWETRRGREKYGGSLGDNPIQGLHEFTVADGTTHLMAVHDGNLYRKDGESWTRIPIRLYPPYPAYPDEGAVGETLEGVPLYPVVAAEEGLVGPNLERVTSYRYACRASLNGKHTHIDHLEYTTITTGLTPHPITVTFHASYGADTHTIFRAQYNGSVGAWGPWEEKATVEPVTTGGKTLIQWTDDGDLPDDADTLSATITGEATVSASLTVKKTTNADFKATITATSEATAALQVNLSENPEDNQTDYLLHTTRRAAWEVWEQGHDSRWEDNLTYFTNGSGLCRTDGTTAMLVEPAYPWTYLEGVAGINALGDFDWPGHTARNMLRQQDVMFIGYMAARPSLFYWCRSVDPTHFPALAVVQTPSRGGEIIDFITKDAQLAVGATTGIWVLIGTTFSPTSSDAYFSEATNFGVASPYCMVKVPYAGWVTYMDTSRRLRALTRVSMDKDRTDVYEVGEALRETLDSLTDHANVFSLWADDQWFLSFPGDQKMYRLYQRITDKGMGMQFAATEDTATAFRILYKLADGSILGAHASTGQLYKLFVDNVFTDDGMPYTFRMTTTKIDGGDPLAPKKWRRVWVFYDTFEPVELTYRIETYEGVLEESVTLAATGFDNAQYDVAQYDPWNLPSHEIDFGEVGPQIQISLEATGWIRIYGLAFEFDSKRP